MRRENERRVIHVNLEAEVFDVRKEALNTFVTVKHPTEKKVAAFLTKRSSQVDTITETDFEKYRELKDIKKLAKKYDAFIAVAPMMSKIASKFGRVFGPMNKMPSPQAGIMSKEDDEMIKVMIKKVGGVVKIRNKEMAVKLAVGKESMNDEQLKENIEGILKDLEKKLPRGRENVKEVLIKFTMTAPIAIVEKKVRG